MILSLLILVRWSITKKFIICLLQFDRLCCDSVGSWKRYWWSEFGFAGQRWNQLTRTLSNIAIPSILDCVETNSFVQPTWLGIYQNLNINPIYISESIIYLYHIFRLWCIFDCSRISWSAFWLGRSTTILETTAAKYCLIWVSCFSTCCSWCTRQWPLPFFRVRPFFSFKFTFKISTIFHFLIKK